MLHFCVPAVDLPLFPSSCIDPLSAPLSFSTVPAAHRAAESHLMQSARAVLGGSGTVLRREPLGRIVRDIQFVPFLILVSFTAGRENACCTIFLYSWPTDLVTRMRNLNFNTCGLTTGSTHSKTSHSAHGRYTGGRNEIRIPRCLCERLSLCSCFGFLTSLHCCVIESPT